MVLFSALRLARRSSSSTRARSHAGLKPRQGIPVNCKLLHAHEEPARARPRAAFLSSRRAGSTGADPDSTLAVAAQTRYRRVAHIRSMKLIFAALLAITYGESNFMPCQKSALKPAQGPRPDGCWLRREGKPNSQAADWRQVSPVRRQRSASRIQRVFKDQQTRHQTSPCTIFVVPA